MTKTAAISKKDLILYSATATPLAFAGLPLYIHAPDYYATNFGVSVGMLGFILLFLRFIDAIQDPLIGRLSDRYSSYRPIVMLLSAIILVISFAALFQPSGDNLLIWFGVFMLVATTSFSVLGINLNTIGGLWSHDVHQKTIITGCREAFGLIGLLLAVLLPSIFKYSMPAEDAFILASLILAALMVIAMVFFWAWQRKNLPKDSIHKEGRQGTWKIFAAMPNSARLFFNIYAISMLASSIPAILVLFFIRDRLGLENYTGLFLFAYFVSGALGMPVWQYISRKNDKYKSWMSSMILAVAVFIWAFFLNEGDMWQYLVICILSGLSFGADLALPPSILADKIHQFKIERDASLYFSVLAFLAKLSLAVASVVVFPFLDAVGFKPGGVNEDDALIALSLSYAAIPCLIKLIAIFILWRTTSGEVNVQNISTDNNISRSNSDV